MKNFFLAFAALAIFSINAVAQTNWSLDKSHTKIQFTAKHLVITEVSGQFNSFDGKVVSKKADDFSDAYVEFSADVNSINTDNQKRDDHLKSDDFFNAGQYPKLTFKSKSFTKIGDNKYKVVGDMTIRNTTKEIELIAEFGGTAKAWGKTKAGFKLSGSLNRFDYGLKWNSLMEMGGAVVDKTINILCTIELDQQ